MYIYMCVYVWVYLTTNRQKKITPFTIFLPAVIQRINVHIY